MGMGNESNRDGVYPGIFRTSAGSGCPARSGGLFEKGILPLPVPFRIPA